MGFSKLVLAGTALFVCVSCSSGQDRLAQPLVPTAQELSTNPSLHTDGILAFQDSSTGTEQEIGVSVEQNFFDPSKTPPEVEFTVSMELGAITVGRSELGFPPGYLERIPDGLIAEAYSEIVRKSRGPAIVELASQLGRASICGQKRVRLDPGKRTRTSLTLDQSQRLAAALGGSSTRLLGMSGADLERLGLGDIANAPSRTIPAIDFEPRTGPVPDVQSDVRVRMLCYL